MNAGEPPDEAGESDDEERSTDPERGDAESDEPVTESPDDAAADGDDGAGLDPAAEVEAAVEDALGPGVLDGDGDDEDVRADERADDAREPDEVESADVTETGEPTDDEPAADSGGDGATGDSADDDAAEDAAGENRDSTDDPSSTGEQAGDHQGDADDRESSDGEDSAEDGEVDEQSGGGIDESAAVEAAQELIDGAGAGDGPEPKGAAGSTGGERSGEVAEGNAPASQADDAGEGTADASDDAQASAGGEDAADGVDDPADAIEDVDDDVPDDVRKYDRFKKIDGGTYDRANEFLRDRTYITAREWAMARLCADFRTETGVEMTKIGENLPELVPFMTDTYTPQAVNQARAAFEEKVRKAGATFLYGAMCDFFTAEELDDVMYEATEVAKFLLEVEGVELSVEEELAAEDHISEVMRDVREHSAALRHDDVTCPECGHEINADE